MRPIAPSSGLSFMAAAKSGWVRRNGLLWSEVEASKGARNWDPELESELISASKNGMETILIVRSAPSWSRMDPASPCGKIKESEFSSFASFLKDAVTRFSKAPYNVKYWEIWNEPDIVEIKQDWEYGCWGISNDDYYGGAYYGDLLQVVYPQIKAADPTAQVLVGGLLLNCDPAVRDRCTDPRPSNFFEGIMISGAGSSFDGVSFHGYDYYLGQLGQYGNGNWASFWNTTGPVLTAKAEYLRSILDKYNLENKFLINSETALIYDGTCDQNCQTTKAYYVVQSYTAAIAADLRANIWFTTTGWRQSGLFDTGLVPLPAYETFAFAGEMFMNAKFLREIDSYAGVQVYEFQRGFKKFWVVWSLDGTNHPIQLPHTPAAIRDAFGDAYPFNGTAVTVNLKPVYIEW